MKTLLEVKSKLKGQYLAINISNDSNLEELIEHAQKQIRRSRNVELRSGKSQEEKINRYMEDIKLLRLIIQKEEVEGLMHIDELSEHHFKKYMDNVISSTTNDKFGTSVGLCKLRDGYVTKDKYGYLYFGDCYVEKARELWEV